MVLEMIEQKAKEEEEGEVARSDKDNYEMMLQEILDIDKDRGGGGAGAENGN